jgi:hypothetical protein
VAGLMPLTRLTKLTHLSCAIWSITVDVVDDNDVRYAELAVDLVQVRGRRSSPCPLGWCAIWLTAQKHSTTAWTASHTVQ